VLARLRVPPHGIICAMSTTADAGVAAILAVVARVPRGRVTTYGSVAARAGLPGRARLVGRVLRELPAGNDLPWHRIVAAAGRIALPEGSPSRSRQIERLQEEGVLVCRGRIDIRRFGWSAGHQDLDRLLWGGDE
jgi:methylated-DNA-protein-cysteine methyltransferase related protein